MGVSSILLHKSLDLFTWRCSSLLYEKQDFPSTERFFCTGCCYSCCNEVTFTYKTNQITANGVRATFSSVDEFSHTYRSIQENQGTFAT